MKKTLFLSLAALATLFACNKAIVTVPEDSELETVPTRIELGTGTTATKADMIDANRFANIHYGVLAVDLADNTVLLAGVEAQNSTPEEKDYTVASFVGGPYYYPLHNDHNFTFFGYRTNEDDDFTYDDSFTVNDIAIGNTDIIWATCAATPYNETQGFNARYIRKIKEAAGEGDYLAGEYAPKLTFNHLTSALIFKIKAASSTAAGTLENIKLTGITINGVKQTARLALLSGTLSSEATAEALAVPSEEEVAISTEATQFGAPVFVLPTAIDPAEYTIALTLSVNNTEETVENIVLTAPEGGYVAGSAYTFSISINSYEQIEVVTALTPWNNVEIPDDIEID